MITITVFVLLFLSLGYYNCTYILFAFVNLQMVELVEGSSVFWFSQHRAYCSSFKSWSSYTNAAVDIFFDRETLAGSSAMGNEKRSKTGGNHQALNQLIVHAIIGK